MCLQAHIIKGTHLGLSVFAAGVPLTATFILNYSLFKMALRIRPSMTGFRPSEIFLFKKFESRNPQTFSAIATKEQTLLKEKKKIHFHSTEKHDYLLWCFDNSEVAESTKLKYSRP